MQIQIESTDQITVIDGVRVRVWNGVTPRGVPCIVFVHLISAYSDVAEEFDDDLQAQLPPGRVVPLSAIL